MLKSCFTILLTSCSLLATAALAQTLPPEIAQSKVVRVAVNTPYEPLEMHDPKSNELIGFDIDLAAAMAKVLGVKLEYTDGAFETMTPALQSGRVDMIMSGFYDTPKRRPLFDFIDYLKAGAQFFTLTSAAEIKDPTDLCGKTVGTIRGTTYPETIAAWSEAHCKPAGKPAIAVTADPDVPQLLINIKTDRAQAGVQGLESVPAIVDMEPGIMRPLGEPFSATLMGIAFDKQNPVLRDAFVFALKKVIADGTYDALIKKWKLGLSAYKEVTVNAGPKP